MKKNRFIYLYILLLSLLITSCKNLLNDIPSTSLSFDLGKEVQRTINTNQELSKVFDENSKVKIVVTLIKNGTSQTSEADKKIDIDIIDKIERTIKLNDENIPPFVFPTVALNNTYKVAVDVFYKEAKIYTALSKEVFLNERNTDVTLDLKLLQYYSKITYDAGNDKLLDTSSYPSSYLIFHKIILPIPELSGFTFDGWYTENGEKVESLGPDNFFGDVKLTAKWIEWDGVQKVSFTPYSPSGNIKTGNELDAGDYIKLSTVTDGALIYYSTDGNTPIINNANLYIEPIPFNSDIQIKAIAIKDGMNPSPIATNTYNSKKYTVTFNNGGYGTAPKDVTNLLKGDKIPEDILKPLTQTGHTFLNWTDNHGVIVDINYTVNENVTVTANWDITKYTISYIGCEGVTNTNQTSYNIDTPTFVISDLQNDGFIFRGWYSDPAFENPATTTITEGSTGNITFYAKLETYPVTFSPENGELDNNDSITLSTLTPGATIHYTLDNGVEQTCLSGTSIKLTTDTLNINAWATKDNMTQSANSDSSYTMKKYTVTFNNGGHGTAPNNIENLKKGDTLTAEQLNINDTNLGFRFLNWNDGKQTVSAGHSITNSLNLTAIWEDILPTTLTNVQLTQKDGIFTFTWDAPTYEDFKEVVITFAGKTVTKAKGSSSISINGADYSLTNDKNISFSLVAKDEGGNSSSAVTKSMIYNPYNLTIAPVLSNKGAQSNVKSYNPTVVEFGDWPQTLKQDNVTVDERKIIKVNGWNCYKGSDGGYYVKVVATPRDPDKTFFTNSTVVVAGTTYFFKMEPLRWVLLNENYTNGKALFMCDMINYSTNYSVSPNLSVNYSTSYVRKCLIGEGDFANFNGDVNNGGKPSFLKNAFTPSAVKYLFNMTLNDVDTTVTDKIILLGDNDKELQNTTKFGFLGPGDSNSCKSRDGHPTDFAVATGSMRKATCDYLCRTNNGSEVNYVTLTGRLGAYTKGADTHDGVRPGISIDFPLK